MMLKTLYEEIRVKDAEYFFRKIINDAYKIKVINFPDSIIYVSTKTHYPVLILCGYVWIWPFGKGRPLQIHIPHDTMLSYYSFLEKNNQGFEDWVIDKGLMNIYLNPLTAKKSCDAPIVYNDISSQLLNEKLLSALIPTVDFTKTQNNTIEVIWNSSRDSYSVSKVFEKI